MTRPAFSCPKCTGHLPGDFANQRYCPYCAHEYGAYARICLRCQKAWFPVFRYCPCCCCETGIAELSELSTAGLGWAPAAPHYAEHGTYGADLSTIHADGLGGAPQPLPRAHDLASLMRFPRD